MFKGLVHYNTTLLMDSRPLNEDCEGSTCLRLAFMMDSDYGLCLV